MLEVMSRNDCILNDLSLDMVTDVDHLNNYCYCAQCSCGKHICPRTKEKLYPKSTFNSYYRINFKRHTPSSKPSNSASPQRRLQFKLESETTQTHDYKPYQIENSKSMIVQQPTRAKGRYKLSTNSTYRQAYINWGQTKAESTKLAKIYTDSNIKFSGSSTYSNCFQKNTGIPGKMIKPTANTNILCSGSGVKTPETTMRSSYNYGTPIPSRPIYREDNTLPLPAFSNQYLTSNLKNYSTMEIRNGIRRAKKHIE